MLEQLGFFLIGLAVGAGIATVFWVLLYDGKVPW